jgi:hypothetical protein
MPVLSYMCQSRGSEILLTNYAQAVACVVKLERLTVALSAVICVVEATKVTILCDLSSNLADH